MKKLKILIVSFFLFVSCLVFSGNVKAQEPETWIISPPPTFELTQPTMLHYDQTTIPGAQFYTLRAGDRAPVAGVLLNSEANAWLIAQYEFIQRFWITEMNRRVDLTLNWGNSEIAGARIRSTTEVEALNVRVNSLQQQNQLLTSTTEHLIRENRRQRILYRLLTSGTAIAIIAAATSVVVITAK